MDGAADVDGVTADAGIDGPRTESQRTPGVGEADELSRRWRGRELQGPGPAVACGGRGTAAEGEGAGAAAWAGTVWAGTVERKREEERKKPRAHT